MSKAVQRRRGTTTEHTTFTGALGELTVDTTKNTVVVHDGAAAGGYPLLREDGSNSALSLGSAGTPSLKFTGDPNTGIYSPGADQVAISTNGTGRLFVDASGQVLDGDSAAGLSFARSVITANPSNSTESAVVQFRRGAIAPSSGDLGSIRFTDLSNYRGASIAASIESAWSAGVSHPSFLSFRTTNSGNTTESEKLRITSDGKLGLGTSSPGQRFEVSGGNMKLAGSTSQPFTNFWGSTDNSAFFLPYGFLGSSGAFAVSLYSNGYRDASPGFTYMGVNGNTSTACGIDLEPNGNMTFRSGTATGTSLPTRMYIGPTGLVGIGTTSPNTLLHVAGNAILDSTDANLKIKAGVAGTTGALNFTFNTDSTVYGGLDLAYDTRASVGLRLFSIYPITIHSASTSTPIIFKQGSTDERARIDSSGRLLVGTSSARSNYGAYGAALLQAEGANNDGARAFSFTYGKADGGDPIISLGKHRSNSVGGVTVVSDGDGIGQVVFAGSDGTNFVTGAVIRAQVDGTPGTNDMPGRLVFSTCSDGSASPTERLRITSDAYVRLASGTGGIQFNGDTAAANALDDYEEGTFTPTDASGDDLSFTSVSGYYTKIGRHVTCQGFLTYPSTASATQARLGGLPFTGSNGGGFSMYVTGTTGSFVMRSQSSTATARITSSTDNDVAITNANLSGAALQFTFFYQIGT